MIKKYKVLQPIGYGGRQEKGTILEIEESYAEAIGSDFVVEVGKDEVASSEAGSETSVDEMSLAELKDKAKELKLPVGGSKADLIERIKLAQTEAQ